MDSRSYFLAAALFLSVAPVVFSVVAHGSIKRTRRTRVRSIDYFFTAEGSANKHASQTKSSAADTAVNGTVAAVNEDDVCCNLVNSLEFLKFKYNLPKDLKKQRNDAPEAVAWEMLEIEPHAWLISGLLLALALLAILSVAALACTSLVSLEAVKDATSIEAYFYAHPTVSLALLASIAGAYTYMVRAFYQAVNNYDLEPSSFFGAASNLVFAITVTQIAVFYLAKAAEAAQTGTAALMIAAFVGAYMPDDILRYFLGLSSIKQLKRERSDFGREIDSVPIEVLDGIDGKVRFRLADFHIEDVQHLASANPLMLFVETPYGFYQTLDWVGQAQLCASVGPEALFELRKLGIRTIFDLERAVLSPGFADDDILLAVQRILLPDLETSAPTRTESARTEARTEEPNHAPLKANVMMRVDGSDTRRLRLIVKCVNKQLGKGAVALCKPRCRLVPG